MKATEIYKKHNGENSVTLLWRNSCLINMRLTYKDKASIKLDRQHKNINPVDYAVWGALQQDVLQSSDRGFGGSQRQSACLLDLISTNNWSTKQLIHPWRQTLKTVVKVHGGHIEQLFTWLHVLLYEDFAVLLRHTRKHAFPVVFHHCDTIKFGCFDSMVLFVNNILTYSLGFGINICRID